MVSQCDASTMFSGNTTRAGSWARPVWGSDVDTSRAPRPWYHPIRYASTRYVGAAHVTLKPTFSPRFTLVASAKPWIRPLALESTQALVPGWAFSAWIHGATNPPGLVVVSAGRVVVVGAGLW